MSHTTYIQASLSLNSWFTRFITTIHLWHNCHKDLQRYRSYHSPISESSRISFPDLVTNLYHQTLDDEISQSPCPTVSVRMCYPMMWIAHQAKKSPSQLSTWLDHQWYKSATTEGYYRIAEKITPHLSRYKVHHWFEIHLQAQLLSPKFTWDSCLPNPNKRYLCNQER